MTVSRWVIRVFIAPISFMKMWHKRQIYCQIPLQVLSYKALNGVKTFEHKKCPFCHSKQVKKNGKHQSIQQYKCQCCNKYFNGGKRLNPQTLWQAYTIGKQTAAQLAEQYKCSRQTILRHLKAAIPKAQFATPSKANVIMDTTYFKRSFGIMVLMDSISGKALFVSEVKHETNELYAQAIGSLKVIRHSNPKHRLRWAAWFATNVCQYGYSRSAVPVSSG